LEILTILQTKESSPNPEGLDDITQGMAAIPIQNQPMDDEEALQYFTPAPLIPAPIQINMAEAQKSTEDDEETRAA